MLDEEAFLNRILERPDDDVARLVYADWLDERGDTESLAKAEFLRGECELAELAPEEKRYGPLREQLREVARPLDTDWLAAVSKLPIEECGLRFRFRCPKQWEALQPTDRASVRFCTECEQNVYYCDSIQRARAHARQGHCVAVDLAIPRKRGDLGLPRPSPDRRLGRVRVEDLRRPRFRADAVSRERERRRRQQEESHE